MAGAVYGGAGTHFEYCPGNGNGNGAVNRGAGTHFEYYPGNGNGNGRRTKHKEVLGRIPKTGLLWRNSLEEGKQKRSRGVRGYRYGERRGPQAVGDPVQWEEEESDEMVTNDSEEVRPWMEEEKEEMRVENNLTRRPHLNAKEEGKKQPPTEDQLEPRR
ncbi:hypothetical protein K438DRAFT_1761730 [Mycena galopus ATCC 62051]|nr:hypothetical protein K438DRAFT_1761730 [Mycena galopus ATCC 62051]